MADYFVDAARGDDANPGSAERPLLTITQALALAAASADAGGAVFVAAGEYGPPAESFPLLVPPGYAVQGAGRDRTVVRFTGEVRMVDGTIGGYWSGTVIHVGSALRGLTVRADPATTSACRGTAAIVALNDGTMIEDVDVRGPQLPEEHPDPIPDDEIRETFTTAIAIKDAAVTVRNSSIRFGGDIRASAGGRPVIENVRAVSVLMRLSSDAIVRNCEFHYESLSRWAAASFHFPAVSISGGDVAIGPGNYFAFPGTPVLHCTNGAQVSITDNELASMSDAIYVDDRAVVDVQRNFIGKLFGDMFRGRLIDVADSAGEGCRFDDNVFYASYARIVVRRSVDFGGGAAGSRGGNHFGGIRVVSVAPPGLIIDAGTGVVDARDNFWSNGRPGDQTLLESGAIVTDGARVDDVNPTTARDMFFAIRTAHGG